MGSIISIQSIISEYDEMLIDFKYTSHELTQIENKIKDINTINKISERTDALIQTYISATQQSKTKEGKEEMHKLLLETIKDIDEKVQLSLIELNTTKISLFNELKEIQQEMNEYKNQKKRVCKLRC